MRSANIYLSGVGGQGIGLLSGTLSAAAVTVGYQLRGCETHGLAQRGGVVVSHIRIGDKLFAPRVPPGQADLVIALERLEALRAGVNMLRSGGTLVYYDSQYQPLAVRLGTADYPEADEIVEAVEARQGRLERVFDETLTDPRMQNVALLGRVAALGAIEGLTPAVLEQALADAVPPKLLDANLAVFRRQTSA